MKTLAEQMREAMNDIDGDGSQEIYVDGFGTWDASSLRSKITRDTAHLSDLANRGDFEAIHASLNTGVLVSIVGALVAATTDQGEQE